MVRLRIVADDGRSPAQRAQDLHRARDRPEAREQLAAVLDPLRDAQRCLEAALADADPDAVAIPSRFWQLLDQAYLALDRYLADLLHTAAIDPSCGPRCSACCTDLPPILPIEGLRMIRALSQRDDGPRRLQRAIEQTRAFQEVLRAHTRSTAPPDATDPGYREAQIAWRRLGHPCPVLGDDGNCGAYESRPLSCRAHIHVEDPAHCEPGSPRFLIA
ncbi:MAG TPA: YkgJ family cysteine cluster protein, partial [Enhygromyxa sp.]|nr:YkgJ family cysteine cluster protein [Enhygromyxa sp.]